MRIVPLHCLVMIVGDGIENTMNNNIFPSHEYIRIEDIRQELTGGRVTPGLDATIHAEVARRLLLKLQHGERVVIDASAYDKDQRVLLANSATAVGVPVFYLVCSPDNDLMRGDGVAEVLDARSGPVRPIVSMLDQSLTTLRNSFSGITVIGDVHGMHQTLLNALTWARNRNHFVVFLGDVVDYGPSTLEVADEVYRTVTRGEGTFVLGNHERKIMRWIDGHRVRLSDGNRMTTRALESLTPAARAKWVGRFRGLYQNGELIKKIGAVTFAHAAVHPSIWKEALINRYVENHAFFGEVDDRTKSERPVLSHRWVDAIPEGHVVVVGHEIRSYQAPVVQTGLGAGKAVFLDTGCGKGGPLSSVDFRFTDTGMQLMNFNTH